MASTAALVSLAMEALLGLEQEELQEEASVYLRSPQERELQPVLREELLAEAEAEEMPVLCHSMQEVVVAVLSAWQEMLAGALEETEDLAAAAVGAVPEAMEETLQRWLELAAAAAAVVGIWLL